MELRVTKIEDRKIISGILIENGYRVEQCKIARIGKDSKPARTLDSGLKVEDVKGKEQ